MRLAKAARTGGILLPVLALAALLALSGCGGGSSSETTAANSTNDNAESGKDSAAGAASKGTQSPAEESGNGKQGSNVSQPNGEREPGITPEQRRKATTADISLESPTLTAGAGIPARHTCAGEDESPPLKWSGLPDDAAELVLLVLNSNPVNEALFFDWAVAGLDPSLEGIEEGKLPPGAVVGKNSFGKNGYSICPPEAGKSESYVFMLYAIPEVLSPEEGFDPLPLREAVVDQSGHVGFVIAHASR